MFSSVLEILGSESLPLNFSSLGLFSNGFNSLGTVSFFFGFFFPIYSSTVSSLFFDMSLFSSKRLGTKSPLLTFLFLGIIFGHGNLGNVRFTSGFFFSILFFSSMSLTLFTEFLCLTLSVESLKISLLSMICSFDMLVLEYVLGTS